MCVVANDTTICSPCQLDLYACHIMSHALRLYTWLSECWLLVEMLLACIKETWGLLVSKMMPCPAAWSDPLSSKACAWLSVWRLPLSGAKPIQPDIHKNLALGHRIVMATNPSTRRSSTSLCSGHGLLACALCWWLMGGHNTATVSWLVAATTIVVIVQQLLLLYSSGFGLLVLE